MVLVISGLKLVLVLLVLKEPRVLKDSKVIKVFRVSKVSRVCKVLLQGLLFLPKHLHQLM